MIKPTFNVLLLTVPLFIFALMVGGTIPYFILYTYLIVILLPWLHGFYVVHQLDAKITLPNKDCFIGDSFTVQYHIHNQSLLPIPHMKVDSNTITRLAGKHPSIHSISLESKGDYMKTETLKLQRRGYYTFGEIKVQVSDVFNLFTFEKAFQDQSGLLVYPHIVQLNAFEIKTSQQSGELHTNNLAYLDRSQIHTLRDYQPGDNVKHIHWKVSARKNRLIVKDYDSRGDSKVELFLDNFAPNYENDTNRTIEDRLVEICTSIVNNCLNENISVSFHTANIDSSLSIKGSSKSDLRLFLKALAMVQSNGSVAMIEQILSKKIFFSSNSTIILFTPVVDKKLASLLIQLQTENYHPVLFTTKNTFTITNSYAQHLVQLLESEGVFVHILSPEGDPKVFLEKTYDNNLKTSSFYR